MWAGNFNVNGVPIENCDSESMLAEASRLVKEFPECFWFRHPEATVDNRDDVVLVIRHLREYGGHRAWRAAQQLWKKCR